MGGAFYAQRMLSYCSAGMSGVGGAQEHGADQSQQRAVEALKERCGDFVPSDYEMDKSLLTDAKDPLFAAGRSLQDARLDYSKSKSTDALQKALDVVLAQRDPLLMDELGARLVTYTNPATGRPAYFFAGKIHPLGDSPDVGLAVYLLPCELGLRCDASEPRAQLRCASGAGCEGGRAAEVQEMLRSRPDEFAKVQLLAKEMAAAVTQGNSAAFLPR